MAIITPKDVTVKDVGGELPIDEAKQIEMVAKTKELLGDTPMEFKDLMDALEQYYITEHSEHYTGKQLREVVAQVQEDLAPVAKESTLEELTK